MFFDEWKDDAFSKNLVRLICLGVILSSIFITVTTEILTTELFMYLTLSAMIILVVTQVELEKKLELLNANYFRDRPATYMFLIAGILLGLFISLPKTSGGLALVLPTQGIALGDLQFYLANVVAPTIEPLFWRGIVTPTFIAIGLALVGFKRDKKNTLKYVVGVFFGVMAAAALFGFFHTSVFIGQVGTLDRAFDLVWTGALFGLIFALGNQLARCIAFECGWHFVNNLFSEGLAVTQIIPTIIVGFVLFAILIEFANAISRR